jgi:hypothetical protein
MNSSVTYHSLQRSFNRLNTKSCLDSVKQDKFHSNVAKLLYLAKRGRPDILLAVNFLTTVSCSTAEDWQKFDRVMKYLHGTLNLNLCLSGSKG